MGLWRDSADPLKPKLVEMQNIWLTIGMQLNPQLWPTLDWAKKAKVK